MNATEINTPSMPNARDALYQFVQERLTAKTNQSLAEFILARRGSNDGISYRRIASEIVNLTGVDISPQAVPVGATRPSECRRCRRHAEHRRLTASERDPPRGVTQP
jgi:hypothetical protein